METPEEDCNQNAGKRDQKKADKCLIQGNSHMVKDRTILCHFQKTGYDTGRAAEDKGINNSGIGTDFPL